MAIYLKIAAKTTTADSPDDYKTLKFLSFPDKLSTSTQPSSPAAGSTLEHLNQQKLQRKKSAEKLVNKISLPPPEASASTSQQSSPPWKPKASAPEQTPWVPSTEATPEQSSIPIIKKPVAPAIRKGKGKIYKLDDL